MRQPIRQRDILEAVAPEHLQEYEVGVAGIADEVAERFLHIADIAGLEVLGHDLRTGVEHRHRALPGDVILPFVGIGMPMHLAQGAGMERHQRRGDGLRRLEIAAVGDACLTAGGLAGRRHAAELERRRDRHLAGGAGRLRLVGRERARHLTLEDVEVVQGDVFEGVGRHPEVERQDIGRRVREPLVEQQRVVFGRAAVVEAQDELGAVLADALQGVRQAGGEIPEPAFAHVLDIGAALGVDRRHAHRALADIGPFRRLVPVQLADAAAGQAHVDAGNLLGDLEIGLRDLPRPAAVLDAPRRIVEGGPEHRHVAHVGRGRREGVGKLRGERGVLRTRISGARRIAGGVDCALRRHVRVAVGLGGCRPRRGCHRAGGCGREHIASRHRLQESLLGAAGSTRHLTTLFYWTVSNTPKSLCDSRAGGQKGRPDCLTLRSRLSGARAARSS